MKRSRLLAIGLAIFIILQGCASLQTQWNSKTSDEKARIIIAGMQDDLRKKLEIGRAYVIQHPEHATLWNTKIVPSFDMAAKALQALITLGASQPLTEMKVYETMTPLINEVVAYLVQIGAIKQ